MKQTLFLLLFTIGFFYNSSAQTFELKDSVFHQGDILRKQIFFDYDKSTIRSEFIPLLDSVAFFLIQHKNLTIEVGNHCDERWSGEYFFCLSCKRAQSIVDYLITKGIDKNRLSSIGYNGDNPIIKNAKREYEHQINRRTEFKILRTDYSD